MKEAYKHKMDNILVILGVMKRHFGHFGRDEKRGTIGHRQRLRALKSIDHRPASIMQSGRHRLRNVQSGRCRQAKEVRIDC